MEALLKVKNLSKSYGKQAILKSLNLDVRKGEILALLGPSGSGKSTLLNILAGLLEPDLGEVTMDGNNIMQLKPELRQIGMVFQESLLFPHKSVEKNVTFAPRINKLDKREKFNRFEEVMNMMQLPCELWDKFPHELSGGEAQRVALARALISRPKLLLLDEPLANLDRKLRSELEIELRAVQKNIYLPFLYVTHNQDEAIAVADRLLILNEGSIEQEGETEDVYQNPKTAFVSEFLGRSNLIRCLAVDKGKGLKIEFNKQKSRQEAGNYISTGIAIYPPIASDVKIEAGKKYLYSIRNEKISIKDSNSGNDNDNMGNKDVEIDGKLRDIVFRGQTVDYIVDIEGVELIATESNTGKQLQKSKIGTQVCVTWNRESGFVYDVQQKSK
uniref:Putative spermidine/putrescine transport system ATP-binding protein n=1 Tax=Candidatus Kentrum sp. LFY TaxID=2126342 RepID=A0A450UBG1_9GAMM|nr:MAG: putative spermidine/putrescine transport system ATP-binding protein [Candidatus Kentron sp. LFY]